MLDEAMHGQCMVSPFKWVMCVVCYLQQHLQTDFPRQEMLYWAIAVVNYILVHEMDCPNCDIFSGHAIRVFPVLTVQCSLPHSLVRTENFVPWSVFLTSDWMNRSTAGRPDHNTISGSMWMCEIISLYKHSMYWSFPFHLHHIFNTTSANPCFFWIYLSHLKVWDVWVCLEVSEISHSSNQVSPGLQSPSQPSDPSY